MIKNKIIITVSAAKIKIANNIYFGDYTKIIR